MVRGSRWARTGVAALRKGALSAPTCALEFRTPLPRRRDRLVVHVIDEDGRAVQLALYGWQIEYEASRRSVVTWNAVHRADTEEPLSQVEEERYRASIIASVLVREAGPGARRETKS